MIVREVGAPPSVLERLLQVDRIASLEALPAFGDRSTDSTGARAAPASANPTTGPAAQPATTATLIAALPLGQSVTARVVDVPLADHVIAEIGDLQIALAWPASSGIAPQPGQDLMLKVLAHPVLLFQSVEAEPDVSNDDGEVRWSSDALRLQGLGATTTASPALPGAVHFDIPILQVEGEPMPSPEVDADGQDLAPGNARGAAASPVPVDRSSDWHILPSPIERARSSALDDVIAGHTTALVNGIDAPLIPHLQEVATTLPFSPLVLQGPAWDGQPMELVVRRERDDELFDNPVLDHWCGEVTIDLPHLGRVAGHLSFSMQGLRVRIEGDDEHGVMTMTAASSELAAALAHADLRVAGLTVAGRLADATRTDWGGGTDFGYGTRYG